jgi:hypothetical protein
MTVCAISNAPKILEGTSVLSVTLTGDVFGVRHIIRVEAV